MAGGCSTTSNPPCSGNPRTGMPCAGLECDCINNQGNFCGCGANLTWTCGNI
jgi:hypothetical protein